MGRVRTLRLFNCVQPSGWMSKSDLIMMNNCSKASAYMNAQAVMASAIMFGHGDVVTMSVNESAIVLSLVCDYDGYVEEREIDWLMGRCMCGVKHFCAHDPSIRCFSIIVTWEFNKDLKF